MWQNNLKPVSAIWKILLYSRFIFSLWKRESFSVFISRPPDDASFLVSDFFCYFVYGNVLFFFMRKLITLKIRELASRASIVFSRVKSDMCWNFLFVRFAVSDNRRVWNHSPVSVNFFRDLFHTLSNLFRELFLQNKWNFSRFSCNAKNEVQYISFILYEEWHYVFHSLYNISNDWTPLIDSF